MDIAWTGDNQRICVVGEGKEKLGVVFMWDAGSSVGDITGQTHPLLSCDLKQTRPFRLITTGEDNYPCWFEGPPFKFKKSMKDIHTRFINCSRFSPSGDLVVCVSSDKIVSVFDGKTGDLKYKKQEHKAGVYNICWSPDSKTFMTASADKTCKIWNAEDGTILKTIELGTKTEHQQLGCLWTNKGPISVNLEGEMSFINAETGAIEETVTGHSKGITAIKIVGNYLYSGSNDGRVIRWDKTTGKNMRIKGSCHASAVNQFIEINEKEMATLGCDDSVKFFDVEKFEYTQSVPTESPANCGIITKEGVIVVGTNKGIKVIKDYKVASTIAVPNGVASIAINSTNGLIAIGLKEASKIDFYTLEGTTLKLKNSLTEEVQGTVYAVAFSPDGKYFIQADNTRYILLREAESLKILYNRWVPHTTRVNKLAFNADSTLIASGGNDPYSYTLNIETKKQTQIDRSHTGGIADITFDGNMLYTCGGDCCIKAYEL